MRPLAVVRLAALGLLSACSDPPATPDAPPPRAYGMDCQEDGQCASGLCVDSVCSRECQRLADCPNVENIPYDCGEITEKNNILACYPRRAPTVPYTVGYNCSLDLKCAYGFRCMGPDNTADRYCSKTCGSDRDCPPRFRCAQARVGVQPPEPDTWCRRRDFCHPCVIDDQCGVPPENLCLRDQAGRGYCSKSCDPAGTGCPTWAQCESVGQNQFACKPKSGTCFTPDGGLCANCTNFGWQSLDSGDFTINEPGTCQADAACYLLSKAWTETVCITPCAADGSCPPANGAVTYSCFDLKSLAGKYCLPSPDGKTFGSCVP